MIEKKDNSTEISFWNYRSLLVEYLRPQILHVTLLSILLLSSIGLALINPQIIRFYLDSVESGSPIETLIRAAGLFMGMAVIRQIVNIAVTYMGEDVAWTATNNLRADLALHCLKLDMAFHKQYKPGELIERVDGDVNLLANFFSQMVIRLTGNLLLVIGALILLTIQQWQLGLVITIIVVAGLFLLHRLNKISVPRWQIVREVEAKLFGFLEEWLNGTEEIRTSGAEEYIMIRLYKTLRERYKKVISAMRIQVIVSNLPLGVFALAYIAAFIFGQNLYLEGIATIGGIYLIFYYIDLMKDPLWEILRQVEDFQRAGASMNRITEIRNIQPTIRDGPGVNLGTSPLALAFEDVWFHYADDPETFVLKGISFQIEPGSVLGLLGRTGSGKSTLTKLIFRFYDPSSGSIQLGTEAGRYQSEIDYFQIPAATQKQLRRSIGMVTQEVQLFNATVRQNLSLFDPTIPDHQIESAINEIGLRGWFSQLSEGLDTNLNSASGGLSAGEAQLLAFARVFLSNPGLIILDEASSRLDPATENLIEKAIDRLLVNRTAIIIAHRLETLHRADKIMILEDGRIAEFGDREDLVQDSDSLFSHLLSSGMQEALA